MTWLRVLPNPAAAMRPAVAALCIIVAAGCASSGSVRELGQSEKQMFVALDERLEENETFVRKASDQLGELGADYARMEFELELALAKAKLLDAMQAPWSEPREVSAVTQRAIVLYHFYRLELAEEKVLEARIRERRARARELYTAYRKLKALVADAGESLEVVLENLNQPTSAQIRAFTATFLAEVTAFREELRVSDNPRLRELADEVERYEEAARKTTEDAERALAAILKLSE